MSGKNEKNAAPDRPASVEGIEIEPLKDAAVGEAARGNCSVHHCSVWDG